MTALVYPAAALAEIAGCFAFLGMVAAGQIAPVAGSRRGLAYTVRLAADTRR